MTRYKPSDVSSRYGAPMGRHGDSLSALQILPSDPPFTLQRVRLNGGYDSGGAYWGAGQPLFYWAITLTVDECSGHLRANNREHAKAQIRALLPAARFYR